MTETRYFVGRCHCGNIEVTFETKKSPEQLGVRICTCSFCTRHGVRTTTDPEGSVRVTVHNPAKLNRYRFGMKTADFLICQECGVYLGAVYTEHDAAYATLNVNTLESLEAFAQEPTLVSYDHETEAERRARRKAKWTPVKAITT